MYTLLYESRSEASLRLWARSVAGARAVAGGRALLAAVTREDFAATGAGPEETDGIVDSLRGVDGVEVAALVKEQTGGVRVSLARRPSTSAQSPPCRAGAATSWLRGSRASTAPRR